jgi:hypothetical protein
MAQSMLRSEVNKVIIKYSMVMRFNKMRWKVDNWQDLPAEFRAKATQTFTSKEQLYEILGIEISGSFEEEMTERRTFSLPLRFSIF